MYNRNKLWEVARIPIWVTIQVWWTTSWILGILRVFHRTFWPGKAWETVWEANIVQILLWTTRIKLLSDNAWPTIMEPRVWCIKVIVKLLWWTSHLRYIKESNKVIRMVSDRTTILTVAINRCVIQKMLKWGHQATVVPQSSEAVMSLKVGTSIILILMLSTRANTTRMLRPSIALPRNILSNKSKIDTQLDPCRNPWLTWTRP